MYRFSDKINNFEILGPNLPKKWILGSKFQKCKSGFGINTSKIPCVPIFSQNVQLLIFQPKFGEIAQLRPIFWFKHCGGCCRELGGGWNELGGGGWSWVKVEMSWVEVDGARWSWVEVDGAGWSWVHGLVIPTLNEKSQKLEWVGLSWTGHSYSQLTLNSF